MDFKLTPFPTLETERLLLRQIKNEDVNEIFILRSHPDVMQYISRPVAANLEDALNWIAIVDDLLINNNGITWAMTLKGESKMFGSVGLWRFEKEHFRAEIGYAMMPEYNGKGYMTEAIQAVLKYGFETLGVHSVIGCASPENKKSIATLERNNFVREAYFKENFFWEGKFLDSVVYTILAPQSK